MREEIFFCSAGPPKRMCKHSTFTVSQRPVSLLLLPCYTIRSCTKYNDETIIILMINYHTPVKTWEQLSLSRSCSSWNSVSSQVGCRLYFVSTHMQQKQCYFSTSSALYVGMLQWLYYALSNTPRRNYFFKALGHITTKMTKLFLHSFTLLLLLFLLLHAWWRGWLFSSLQCALVRLLQSALFFLWTQYYCYFWDDDATLIFLDEEDAYASQALLNR